MMVVTPTLLAAFRGESMGVFVAEMAQHCRESVEGVCTALTDEELRCALEATIEAAAERGFSLRGPVRLYIDLSAMLGSGFDSDPQYSWAGEIFESDDYLVEEDRAHALYDAACEYCDAVETDGYSRLAEALDEVVAQPPTETVDLDGGARRLVECWRQAAPAKVECITEEGLAALAASTLASAKRLELTEPSDVRTMALLMFFLGHGCDKDVFLPWLPQTLRVHAATAVAARPPAALAAAMVKQVRGRLLPLEHIAAFENRVRVIQA